MDSSDDDDDNSTVPSISSSEHRPEPDPPTVSAQQSYDIVQDSEASTEESDKADWSDWDDVEQNKDEPISIQDSKDSVTTSQSESILDGDKDDFKPLDDSRTSNEKKESSDWSGDWSEPETDVAVAKQKEHIQKDEGKTPKKEAQVPKKKTSALQLKSSLKKKANSNTAHESKIKDESKPSVAKKTPTRKKFNKSANNATHKASTQYGQDKTPQELGKEYDIPDITVVTTPEPDFFADMEPTMSFGKGSASAFSAAKNEKEASKAVLPAKSPVTNSTSSEIEPLTTSTSLSFAVTNLTVTVGPFN